MAHGIKFDGFNKSYGPPHGVSEEQCATLHVFTNGSCIVSCWQLTPAELEEVNRTGKVFQSIWSGDVLFPSLIGSESVVHEVVADFGAVWKLSKTEPRKPTAYICEGCDTLTTDPEKQMQKYRDNNRVACCPERKMIGLYR